MDQQEKMVDIRKTDEVVDHLMTVIEKELIRLGAVKVDIRGGSLGLELYLEWWASDYEHDHYAKYWG